MNAMPPAIVADQAPLPANIVIEQGLLGAVMLDQTMLHAVSWFLKPEHFYEPIHRQIYEVASRLGQDGRRVTYATLLTHLQADAVLIPGVDVKTYLARLAAESVNTTLAVDYAKSIVDLARRRELILLAQDISDRAYGDGFEVQQQIGEAVERLSVLSVAVTGRQQRQSTAGHAAANILERMNNGVIDEPPLPTQLTDLDRIIGGLRRGTLMIAAGRPGMGKSLLAGTVAMNVAKPPSETTQGVGVLFFSKEMTGAQLVTRMLTALAYESSDPITYKAVMDGGVPAEHHRHRLGRAAAWLNKLPLIIDPQPGLSMPEIAARTGRVSEAMERKGVKLGAVIVDHLGKVKTPRGREGRNIELGDVTNAAAEMAKQSDCSALMLCQLNRQVEGRDNKRPTLSDLRESGHIEEDADVVLGLYREAYYLQKQAGTDGAQELDRQQRLDQCRNDLEVIVLKNRHGADGRATLWVDPSTGAIADREYVP